MKQEDVAAWFTIKVDGSLDSDYCNLRLQQLTPGHWKQIENKLKVYIEHAHADARKAFFKSLGICLDPLQEQEFDYPRSLPIEAKKGFFGEIFCGILAETQELVGRKKWKVPAFLFRFHPAATEYLERLILGADVPNKIPGRTGSDFIALSLDENGEIKEFLVGEAKCHQDFNITLAHEAISKLSKDPQTPIGLPQLKQILSETDKETHARTILSIEKCFIKENRNSLPRTDLFVYIFSDPKIKKYSTPRITESNAKKRYKKNRQLQVAEVQIVDLGILVSHIYNNIYLKETGATNVSI